MPRPGPFAPNFASLSGSLAVSQMGANAFAIDFVLSGVNFNSANTDNAIALSLPSGFTRYLVTGCRICAASASLTTATCGLFTAAAAGGTAIVTGATAITVSTASESTNNNAQSLTIQQSSTATYLLSSIPTLYFRVQTAQGSAATASVVLTIVAMP